VGDAKPYLVNTLSMVDVMVNTMKEMATPRIGPLRSLDGIFSRASNSQGICEPRKGRGGNKEKEEKKKHEIP